MKAFLATQQIFSICVSSEFIAKSARGTIRAPAHVKRRGNKHAVYEPFAVHH